MYDLKKKAKNIPSSSSETSALDVPRFHLKLLNGLFERDLLLAFVPESPVLVPGVPEVLPPALPLLGVVNDRLESNPANTFFKRTGKITMKNKQKTT